jgi:hypothetical protein
VPIRRSLLTPKLKKRLKRKRVIKKEKEIKVNEERKERKKKGKEIQDGNMKGNEE